MLTKAEAKGSKSICGNANVVSASFPSLPPMAVAFCHLACYLHILNKIEAVEQTAEYEEALRQCGSNMVQWLVHVYPLIMRAKLEAIKDYGVRASPEDVRKFEEEMKALSENDDELKALDEKQRSKLMPAMNTGPPDGDNTPNQ
ncbi:hypothetical protein D918_08699 [Trichuris suis]|nr:hypothetical protein D918_08699 [Trichuris suis]